MALKLEVKLFTQLQGKSAIWYQLYVFLEVWIVNILSKVLFSELKKLRIYFFIQVIDLTHSIKIVQNKWLKDTLQKKVKILSFSYPGRVFSCKTKNDQLELKIALGKSIWERKPGEGSGLFHMLTDLHTHAQLLNYSYDIPNLFAL